MTLSGRSDWPWGLLGGEVWAFPESRYSRGKELIGDSFIEYERGGEEGEGPRAH